MRSVLIIARFLALCSLFFAGSSHQLFAQKSEFSLENARSILSVLVNDIGPRPMGSPAEHKALSFAVSKFIEYGCDQAYVMPMAVAKHVNTNSGIAVGVKKGKTGRIIIIGGHIDSAGPEIPGANDDGSGSACVIELARVIGKRENLHTVIFCCWGGEEEGLRGSTHFVENFKDLDSVDLMLQLDMADGKGPLLVDPNGEKASAPQWLVEAAFDVAHGELGYNDVLYWTHESTLNRAAGGVFGSDHIPFIDKGIPAIDFTSDPTFPIHTAQDSWENFTPSGLQRSGDIALKLFERYDASVPPRSSDHYLLFQFGSFLIFLPYWLLWGIIILGLVVAVFTFVILLRNREPMEPALQARWSGFKLFLFCIIIQTFIWSSDGIVGLVRGYRYPWVNNYDGFWTLGILFGILGTWCMLQLARRFRLTYDAFAYSRVGIILLVVYTLLTSAVNPEFGVYFASALLLVSVSLLLRNPFLKLALLAAGVFVIYRLAFFESIGLFQRLLALNQNTVWWNTALIEVVLILLYSILSFPFVYVFAALYCSSGTDLLGLRRLKTRRGLGMVCGAIVVLTIVLLRTSVYDRYWHSGIRATQEFTYGADSSTVFIRGTEYLDGVRLNIRGRDSVLSGRVNSMEIPASPPEKVEWCSLVRQNSGKPVQSSDTTLVLERCLEIHSRLRPLRVDVTYRSEGPYEVSSSCAYESKGRASRQFTWYAFPDTLIVLPVSFTLRDSQTVTEEIEIRYDTLSYDLQVWGDLANISYRTIVTARDTFSVHKPGNGLAVQ